MTLVHALLLTTCGGVAGFSVTVDTSLGPVTGDPAIAPLGRCAVFYGIPYAAPPTGNNRFRPPQPKTPWQQPRSAKKVGKSCLQGFGDGFIPIPQSLEKFLEKHDLGMDPMDEDCLYLNVFSPNLKATDLPVMAFIHGGAFLGGSGDRQSSLPFYDGHNLCHDGGTVVVTMNYRLGIFGFYASEELQLETGTLGNMGIQDQRAALEWVQANAHNFGGSSKRVTIFGESAGAFSVASHLIYPRSAHLFSAAIMESGGLTFYPRLKQINRSQAVAAVAGCPGGKGELSCLRSVNQSALLHAQMAAKLGSPTLSKTSPWDHSYIPFPTLDGYELPVETDIRRLVANGNFSAKPVVIGTNRNESSLFTCFTIAADLSESDMRKTMATDLSMMFDVNVTEAQLDHLVELYNAASYGTWKRAYVDFNTDITFYCDSRAILDGIVTAKQQAYSYHLEATVRLFKVDPCLGTPHATDLFYLWQNFNGILTDDEQALGKRMVKYWTNFAKDHVPGKPWPAYGTDRQYLRLDIPQDTPASQWKTAQCEVLGSIISSLEQPTVTIV